MRLDLVIGQMEVWQNGKTVKSSGVMQIDADGTPHVFIKADSKSYSPEQLYDHEIFHAIVSRNKGLWQDIVRHLYETRSREEIRTMVDAYVQAYDGCYGPEEADEEKYLEEIFADLYGEMRRGGGQQRTARNIAESTAQRFAGDIENARQNRAGIDRRNGPGTRLATEDVGYNSGNDDLSDSFTSAKENAEIISLITKVKSGSYSKGDTISLGEIDSTKAATIKKITGIDVTGFEVKLEPRMVEHIIIDHGAEGKTDKSMENDGYIARIEYAINNAESIVDGGTTNAYVSFINGRNKPARTVLYETPIGKRSYYVVEAVPDNARRTLYIVSAFIGSKGYKKGAMQFTDANGPGATSINAAAFAPKHSIQQDTKKSNSSENKNSDAVDWEGNREQRLSVSDKSNAGYESVEHISPREIVPRNDVEKDRMEEVRERAANTTEWQGRPMLAYERAGSLCAITGSHRLAVARLAGYDVDAVILRENELADLEQYLQEETYWDLDDFLERMDEADQADYLNQAVEKGYDSLREAAALMNEEVEGNDARYSRFSPSEDAGDSWGVDWIGKENGPEERGRQGAVPTEESYKWSAIRDRVAEMNERQRRNLVEQAAGLDEDTWRENGLGIKPYSGSLNDVEAILRYVDDAVDTLNAESGPEYYDPSFEIEALPENKESDSRFSATDEGDSWGVDWIGKENGPEERGSTSSASRSEAPSPQGEGLETGEADSSPAAQNDRTGEGRQIAGATEENGGRSMSAPAEERGRQSAVPTELLYNSTDLLLRQRPGSGLRRGGRRGNCRGRNGACCRRPPGLPQGLWASGLRRPPVPPAPAGKGALWAPLGNRPPSNAPRPGGAAPCA